jgi:hypothetical protein
MGHAKRQMAHRDEQLRVATAIAIESGVLSCCEFHGMVWEISSDKTPAYMLGNWKFTAGKVTGMFDSRTEMSDTIKEACEASGVCCTACDKALED